MTFTEAAVEVLRTAKKPLHYKKITELAIEKNLLSHVGKTPEVTMSSRLATMVKKDRGDAPIVKIKPGVFGLRDSSEGAVEDHGDSPEQNVEQPSEDVESKESDSLENEKSSEQESNTQMAPGSDLFPEEDDDDEPILAKLDQEEKERKSRRKRRTRKRPSDVNDESGDEREVRSSSERSSSSSERSSGSSERRRFEPRRTKERTSATRSSVSDSDLKNKDLVEAIEIVLESGRRKPLSVLGLTELLIHRGRLTGDPSMLIPTVVSSIRGHISRSKAREEQPKIWIKNQMVGLRSWSLSVEQQRAEKELQQSVFRWKEASNRAFLHKIADLPTSGWMELIAAWLNAEGVTKLRGIRREGGPSEAFHLCGELKGKWGETQNLAIVIFPHNKSIGREEVIEIRGALHHYGQASAAWLVTTRQVLSGAQDESRENQASTVVLFDGFGLAQAMAKAGIGHQSAPVHLSWIDEDFLEQLVGKESRDSEKRPSRTSNGSSSDRSRSRRDRDQQRRNTRRSFLKTEEVDEKSVADDNKEDEKASENSQEVSVNTTEASIENETNVSEEKNAYADASENPEGENTKTTAPEKIEEDSSSLPVDRVEAIEEVEERSDS